MIEFSEDKKVHVSVLRRRFALMRKTLILQLLGIASYTWECAGIKVPRNIDKSLLNVGQTAKFHPILSRRDTLCVNL